MYRDEADMIIDVIKKGTTKQANLIMVAHAGLKKTNKYTYLHTGRHESNADTDEQEEIWLDGMESDVFEAESYGVQRTQKNKSGIQGVERGTNLQVKPDRTNYRTSRNELEKV